MRFDLAYKNFKYQPPQISTSPFKEFILKAFDNIKKAYPWNPELHMAVDKQMRVVIMGVDIGVRPLNRKMNNKSRPLKSMSIPQQFVTLKYLCEELESGQIGPSKILLQSNNPPDNIIPLNAIDKETGGPVTIHTLLFGKARLTRHCSFARKGLYAYNDLIPPWNWKTQVPMTVHICERCIAVGKFGLLAKADEHDSFRQLGALKHQWKFQGYHILNKYMVDPRDIYGSRSASKHKQEFGNIIIKAFEIWIEKRIKNEFKNHWSNDLLRILIYIDDYMLFIKSFLKSDRKFEYWILDQFYQFLKLCGIKESVHKRTNLEWNQTLVGLDFEMTDHSVGMTEKHRYKCISGMIIIVQSGVMISDEYESLMGSLNWAGSLTYPFIAFMRRLQIKLNNHIKLNGRKILPIYFDSEDKKDCHMLINWMLKLKRISMYEICDLIPRTTIKIYTDGATNGERPNWNPGIGAYCNGYFFMDVVPDLWREKYERFMDKNRHIIFSRETNIAHFEALAIVAALHTFRFLIKPNMLIQLWCDNAICCSDWANKSSDDVFRMDCVRWTLYNFNNTIYKNIKIEIHYLKSKANKYSDALSRFNLTDFLRHINDNNMPLNDYQSRPIYPELGKY